MRIYTGTLTLPGRLVEDGVQREALFFKDFSVASFISQGGGRITEHALISLSLLFNSRFELA